MHRDRRLGDATCPHGFMQKMLLILYMATAIGIISPQQGLSKETVTWVNENFPPAFIIDGPDKGNGITDGAVAVYKAHLPDYHHRHRVANIARIQEMMKNGEKVCYAGFIRTPQREAYIQFSLPNILTYANALIVKAGSAVHLPGDRSGISLQQILENSSYRLGLTKGRAYGRPIDTLLNVYGQSHPNIFYRGGENELMGLLEMLDNRRIDCTIGYPWEVAYLSNQVGRRDHFSVLPIRETEGHRWVLSYAGCPNTGWGRRFIHRLNDVLIKVRPTEAYLRHLLKWYPPEMETDFRQAYRNRVLSVIQ